MFAHVIYRVIHKSVKHFKNSQQIEYATDHGNSYTDRDRNSPRFFLHISQMLFVSTFGNKVDIYAILYLVPRACQHITVDLLLLSPSGKSGQLCARAFPLKKLENFSLYRRKNYHDPLISLFVVNF
jgi:Golgi nucleoside diphosphatase